MTIIKTIANRPPAIHYLAVLISTLLSMPYSTSSAESGENMVRIALWLDAARGHYVSNSARAPGAISIPGVRDLVWFVSAPTSNGLQGGIIRSHIRSQFYEVKFQEWSHFDGIGARERVGVVGMELGSWNLGTNHDVEVKTGIFNLAGTGDWKTIQFSEPFSSPPQVIVSPQTATGDDAVMARINNITTHSFDVALFEEEIKMPFGHMQETMGFLAVHSPRKNNLLNNAKIEIPHPGGIKLNHQFKTVVENNGNLVSYQLRLEEDQSLDIETRHLTETVHLLIVNDIPLSQVATFVGADPVTIRSSKIVHTQPPTKNTSSSLNDTGSIAECLTKQNITNDCAQGRDALALEGTLKKVGAGHAGFDFTKLDINGTPLPATATQWSCVRDNHTGLVWEVKTIDGSIHDKQNTYRWGGLTALGNRNTGGYYNDWDELVNGSNDEHLCGKTGWRVPNNTELFSLTNYNYNAPDINTDYFPGTRFDLNEVSAFWTSLPFARNLFSRNSPETSAWNISFENGTSINVPSSTDLKVRLVNNGQEFCHFIPNSITKNQDCIVD